MMSMSSGGDVTTTTFGVPGNVTATPGVPGNIAATFEVPGLINIPSNGLIHKVAIARLDLDATMSWVCVPKKDTKTHLNVSLSLFFLMNLLVKWFF